MSNIQQEQQAFSIGDLQTIFTHFSPQDIEGFYQLYQLWTLQQRREEVIAQMHELAQQIVESETSLKAVSPSTIALATLSQFRASGVDDIDLLDRMFERGDAWLDHTLQLFERCERMDMIQGNTTEWCEHALEGAYEWLESMNEANEKSDSNDSEDDVVGAVLDDLSTASINQPLSEEVKIETLPETTEEDFLQKLMSEDGELQEQSQGNSEADEQQIPSDIEEEIEIAIPVMATDTEIEDDSNIYPNSDEDELALQGTGEEAHPLTIDEMLPAEEIQAEEIQIEQSSTEGEEEGSIDDSITESALAQVNEHEEIEYAIPARSSEIQQASEQIETPLEEQEEDSQPTEQEDDTIAHIHTYEEIADATVDASNDFQQESEPPEIARNDQSENLAPPEQDSIDEDLLHSEDATTETTKEDGDDTLETPSFDLTELGTEDVAGKATLEIPAFDLSELDAEDVAREITVETPSLSLHESDTEDIAGKDTVEIPSLELETFGVKDIAETIEASELQEERYASDEDEETQHINVVSHSPMNQDIEAQQAEQQPANVTTEDDHPAESIPSFDRQANKRQENEDLTDENIAQPQQPTDEIFSPEQIITSDRDNTDSLAAIQNDTTETRVQDEQDKNAQYVREVAFAEAASELETNIPPGLSAPDIEDIFPAATAVNDKVDMPLEDSEPDTYQQIEVEAQKTNVTSGQQNKEVTVEENKPQKQREPKRRGFLWRLLAKLLHWR